MASKGKACTEALLYNQQLTGGKCAIVLCKMDVSVHVLIHCRGQAIYIAFSIWTETRYINKPRSCIVHHLVYVFVCVYTDS